MSERLQEVKDNAVHRKEHDFFTEMPYKDFLWLCHQAEVAQALKFQLEASKPLYSRRNLESENKLYRKALEDIRDVNTGIAHKWAKEALEKSNDKI